VPLLGKYSIILQRGGVWREKHHLGIGMKITNKRRICKSCNKNKQNPEKRFSANRSSLCCHSNSERPLTGFSAFKNTFLKKDTIYL
jgi:hypothetical protein